MRVPSRCADLKMGYFRVAVTRAEWHGGSLDPYKDKRRRMPGALGIENEYRS
jgi:hypothetical protein